MPSSAEWAETQAAFAAALRAPGLPPPASLGAHAAKRFDIYRNNVASTMVDALRATFPIVEKLVGEEFFAAVARAHLDTAPPSSPLLFRYGGGFGAFLDGFPPAGSVPYLGDIARLEWARLQAYHAADAAPIGIEALAAVPEDDLDAVRLILHPSLHVLRSRWPVFSIWAAESGYDDAPAVDMNRGESVLVIRPDMDVVTNCLPAGGDVFVAALAESETLGAAAERAAVASNSFDLAAHLGGVFQLGAVIAIADGGKN